MRKPILTLTPFAIDIQGFYYFIFYNLGLYHNNFKSFTIFKKKTWLNQFNDYVNSIWRNYLIVS